ncbi:MAG: hypothetical protein JO133_04990 [Burkholderiaceae bacterium]|nr:hypothetical protein [Burkholderiaceae bacterium]
MRPKIAVLIFLAIVSSGSVAQTISELTQRELNREDQLERIERQREMTLARREVEVQRRQIKELRADIQSQRVALQRQSGKAQMISPARVQSPTTAMQ